MYVPKVNSFILTTGKNTLIIFSPFDLENLELNIKGFPYINFLHGITLINLYLISLLSLSSLDSSKVLSTMTKFDDLTGSDLKLTDLS
jgi:hypothetical protein